MQINELVLGFNPVRVFDHGIELPNTQVSFGHSMVHARMSRPVPIKAKVYLNPPALGGFGAGTQGAAEILARQLEEIGNNPNIQPCYVVWNDSTVKAQDAWYFVQNVQSDYSRVYSKMLTTIDLLYHKPGLMTTTGVSAIGGKLATSYTGVSNAVALVGAPIGSAPVTATRSGALGAVPYLKNPPTTFWPYLPSATVSNWWLGRVRVYDTMTVTGGTSFTAMPTGGTAYNANWVEVKGPLHVFRGDMVIANDLIALVFSTAAPAAGAAQTCDLYVWDKNNGTPQWIKWGTLNAATGAGANPLKSYGVGLTHVSYDEAGIQVHLSDPANPAVNRARLWFRLRRSMYFASVEATVYYAADNNFLSLVNATGGTTPTASNDSHSTTAVGGVADSAISGYGDLTFVSGAGAAYFAGFLYKDPPSNQPYLSSLSPATILLADGTALNNTTKQYGIYCLPNPGNGSGEDSRLGMWQQFIYDLRVKQPVLAL